MWGKNSLVSTVAMLALVTSACAADLSIFEFPEGLFALTSHGNRIHRLDMPGGAVLATEALGQMARVDVEAGVNLVATVNQGIAGRQVQMDVGRVEQVELGHRLAVVTAEQGTAVYFPAMDRLAGVLLGEGYPEGIMVFRDIAALRWNGQVAFYGSIQGRLIQFVFPSQGLRSVHLGEDTVVTTRDDRGTFLHTLTPNGFQNTFLSEASPGTLSARAGKSVWLPVRIQKAGTPWSEPVPLEALPSVTEAAAFSIP